MDLKSAMQAISNGGSPDVATLLLQAIRKGSAKQEEERECWCQDSGSLPACGRWLLPPACPR
jgi:hypothetical protein